MLGRSCNRAPSSVMSLLAACSPRSRIWLASFAATSTPTLPTLSPFAGNTQTSLIASVVTISLRQVTSGHGGSVPVPLLDPCWTDCVLCNSAGHARGHSRDALFRYLRESDEPWSDRLRVELRRAPASAPLHVNADSSAPAKPAGEGGSHCAYGPRLSKAPPCY